MEGDESAKSNGFGDSFSAPSSYDPFEKSRSIARPQNAGPFEPLLNPQNVPDDRNPVEPQTKIPFWDRPKPKKDWYWFLGRLGSGLIALGILMFLFVGYQLWGTGIEEAQSQNKLENKFSEIAVSTSSTSLAPTETDSTETPVATTLAPPAPVMVAEGDPMAIIDLPTIGVTKYVVAGVETADLKKGPGHYPNTPFPGELGNAAIAGHRTTYGEPFRHLDDLKIGDPIVITDLVGRKFTYLVTNQQIVGATDSWVVATTDPTTAILTLTTCHPEFSAKQRLIISAELDLGQSSLATYPAAVYASNNENAQETATEATTDETTTAETTTAESVVAPASTIPATTTIPATVSNEDLDSIEDSADALSRGWFSDPSAIPQTLIWAVLEILIVLGAWQVAKKFRNRIIGAVVGFLPFIIVLYFVFQNVNRLLPPNL